VKTSTLAGASVWSQPVAEWTTTDVRSLNVTTKSMTELSDAIFQHRTFVDICAWNHRTHCSRRRENDNEKQFHLSL